MKSRGLLNKHCCKNKFKIFPLRQKGIVNFDFSHYKSMENISCHSNQSSYPTKIKNTIYVYIRASEEKLFENVDDGWMTDTCIYYKLTYEPLAQVS